VWLLWNAEKISILMFSALRGGVANAQRAVAAPGVRWSLQSAPQE
jgi:hypothetical protein